MRILLLCQQGGATNDGQLVIIIYIYIYTYILHACPSWLCDDAGSKAEERERMRENRRMVAVLVTTWDIAPRCRVNNHRFGLTIYIWRKVMVRHDDDNNDELTVPASLLVAVCRRSV